jgi:polysaccharide biosynthesis/export protein
MEMTKFSPYLLIFFAGIVIMTSCVPNKRLVYLQKPPEPEPGDVRNADTVARHYKTKMEEYTLRPEDIISVRIASLTPGEFDFVQKYEEQLGLIRKLTQYDQSNQAGGSRMRSSGGGGSDGGMSSITLDRLQTGFALDRDGYLELPQIGRVQLSGLTIPQTEELIKEKLKGYFETPVVRVQLLSFHFTILGEVNNEGRYTVFDPNATIIDAITIAGNLNDFADRSGIKIVRFEGEQANVFYINTLSEDLLEQPGFYLRPNDLVIVPPLKARATRKYTLPTYTTTISLVSSTLAFVLFLITLDR